MMVDTQNFESVEVSNASSEMVGKNSSKQIFWPPVFALKGLYIGYTWQFVTTEALYKKWGDMSHSISMGASPLASNIIWSAKWTGEVRQVVVIVILLHLFQWLSDICDVIYLIITVCMIRLYYSFACLKQDFWSECYFCKNVFHFSWPNVVTGDWTRMSVCIVVFYPRLMT